MTLPFSLELNGKPTFFVDKILAGTKIHSIRRDIKDRWKVGKLIHPVIHNRTPQRNQFTYTRSVKGLQEIYIRWSVSAVYVYIDGAVFYTNHTNDLNRKRMYLKMLQLAKNDGFDSIADFFGYFNTDFKGKIIHWTDFIYQP